MVAENPSRSLHKVSEIYDRIAFAGVGKYNEFDQLRVAGVRHADTKGFAFSREDVDARSLANLYAQFLGPGLHPRDEAARGRDPRGRARGRRQARPAVPHRLRRNDHRRGRFAVLGGETETIFERLWPVATATGGRSTRRCGRRWPRWRAPTGTLGPDDLEVAVLERGNGRRAFRRHRPGELAERLERHRPQRDSPASGRRSRRRGCRRHREPEDLTAAREQRPGSAPHGSPAGSGPSMLVERQPRPGRRAAARAHRRPGRHRPGPRPAGQGVGAIACASQLGEDPVSAEPGHDAPGLRTLRR